MTDFASDAEELAAMLALEHRPVAVSFHDDERYGARVAEVPAGCCFWAPAERDAIVTHRSDHTGCSVGAYVHGLLSIEEAAEAADTAALLSSGWVTSADLASAPTLERAPRTVVYEPLADAEHADIVLIRVNPRTLMVLQGAVPELALVAKPQCQIVARAAAGEVVVSPGCAVSRVRTGLPDGELTVALPAGQLVEIVAHLRTSVTADRTVAQFATAAMS